MGLVDRILGRERGALTANQAIRSLWNSVLTGSGMIVTEANALERATVLAAVNILSESFAQLPLQLYRRDGRGRTEAREHPVFRVLHEQANSEMTAYTWKRTAMSSLAQWGNSYSEIERNF